MAIRRTNGRRRIGSARVIVAGLAGAVAMIPPGLAAGLLGFGVNKFGELIAQRLTGGTARAVLLAEHLLIGVLAAIPLAALMTIMPPGRLKSASLGLAYGIAFWFVANTMALPVIFNQPSPWTIGPSALLPSLIVHMTYGVGTALALATAGRSTLAGRTLGRPFHRRDPTE